MTEHNLPEKDDAPWLDCMDGFSTLKNTTLSPTAQAILDAYHFAPLDDELTIAAVLHALATHCKTQKSIGPYISQYEVLSIAKELERKHELA